MDFNMIGEEETRKFACDELQNFSFCHLEHSYFNNHLFTITSERDVMCHPEWT